MDSDMTIMFKKMFENERSKLVYSQGIQIDQFQLGRDDMMDESDMSTTELETSMRMRLRNREALFIKKIDESLLRIAAGTFGDCDTCGDKIELKRLQARPTTTMCVSCKEDQEHKEHVHIDGHRSKSLGRSLRLA